MTFRKREDTGTQKRKLSLEKSLWKGLWTCHKTDYMMMMISKDCRAFIYGVY
jgi:hypothetical protein